MASIGYIKPGHIALKSLSPANFQVVSKETGGIRCLVQWKTSIVIVEWHHQLINGYIGIATNYNGWLAHSLLGRVHLLSIILRLSHCFESCSS